MIYGFQKIMVFWCAAISWKIQSLKTSIFDFWCIHEDFTARVILAEIWSGFYLSAIWFQKKKLLWCAFAFTGSEHGHKRAGMIPEEKIWFTYCWSGMGGSDAPESSPLLLSLTSLPFFFSPHTPLIIYLLLYTLITTP